MSARKTLEDLYAALEGGDMPAAMALMDPQIEWTESEGFVYSGTYHGPQAVLEGVFARLGTEWEGFAAVPDYVIGEGDRAVGIGTYSGTYAASGRSFSARFAHAALVRDGRITHFEQIADTAVVSRALGD